MVVEWGSLGGFYNVEAILANDYPNIVTDTANSGVIESYYLQFLASVEHIVTIVMTAVPSAVIYLIFFAFVVLVFGRFLRRLSRI